MVVILVKSTDLPGASDGEGEEALQLATKPPRTSEAPPLHFPTLPFQTVWGLRGRDSGWGCPVSHSSYEALDTVCPLEQPQFDLPAFLSPSLFLLPKVACVVLSSKHPNSVLFSHERNKEESEAVDWAGKWLLGSPQIQHPHPGADILPSVRGWFPKDCLDLLMQLNKWIPGYSPWNSVTWNCCCEKQLDYKSRLKNSLEDDFWPLPKEFGACFIV